MTAVQDVGVVGCVSLSHDSVPCYLCCTMERSKKSKYSYDSVHAREVAGAGVLMSYMAVVV